MSGFDVILEESMKQNAEVLSRLQESERQEDGLKQSGEIVIANWLDVPSQTTSLAYGRIYSSPEKNYAVISTYKEMIAVEIIDRTGNKLSAVYVDMFTPDTDDDMCSGRTYSVDWSQIKNGFAKVSGFEMDTGLRKTVCRFYFDTELYIQRYEQLNGVPYNGEKAFKVYKTGRKE